jgi:CO dehydrogenase/acetyl-CoA synthase alpha subunit
MGKSEVKWGLYTECSVTISAGQSKWEIEKVMKSFGVKMREAADEKTGNNNHWNKITKQCGNW